MVNEEKQSIESIINLLKESDKSVSGESIAEALGISRVAVWKTVNRLREDGYNIESGRSGYRLIALTDKPLPWELERPNKRIRYFNELDSTMMKAEILLEKGCSDGTTIIAGRQTAGITRDGGRWNSPEGGLYFTRIRTSPLPMKFAGLYSCALCASVARTLNSLFSIKSEFRWPNEITAEGKKICGILTRFSGELNIISAINSGVGVNVNIEQENLPYNASSLSCLTGKTASIKEVLSALLESLEETDALFSETGPESVLLIKNLCKENMETLGRELVVNAHGQQLSGTATDLDSSGALIVNISDEKQISIYKGEDYNYV